MWNPRLGFSVNPRDKCRQGLYSVIPRRLVRPDRLMAEDLGRLQPTPDATLTNSMHFVLRYLILYTASLTDTASGTILIYY